MTDAILRLAFLGIDFFQREQFSWSVDREQLWNLLFGTFYFVLALQVLIRSLAARISISIVFIVQALIFILRFVVMHPEDWWGAGMMVRFQQVAQLIFFSISVFLLNRSPSRDILRL